MKALIRRVALYTAFVLTSSQFYCGGESRETRQGEEAPAMEEAPEIDSAAADTTSSPNFEEDIEPGIDQNAPPPIEGDDDTDDKPDIEGGDDTDDKPDGPQNEE